MKYYDSDVEKMKYYDLDVEKFQSDLRRKVLVLSNLFLM